MELNGNEMNIEKKIVGTLKNKWKSSKNKWGEHVNKSSKTTFLKENMERT